jgi:hypothetical protein
MSFPLDWGEFGLDFLLDAAVINYFALLVPHIIFATMRRTNPSSGGYDIQYTPHP